MHPPYSKNDIAKLLKQAKLVVIPLPDPETTNHLKFLKCSFPLLNQDMTTIPGIECILRMRPMNADLDCNESYALFAQMTDGSRLVSKPVFRIEVYPKTRISHRENGGIWRGSHIHYFDITKRCSATYDCGEYMREKWLKRFFRHIHVKPINGHGQLHLGGIMPW